MCGTPVGVSWTYHLCVGLTMLYKNNKEYTIRTFLVWINPNCILQGSLFNSDGQWFDKLHSPTVIHCISFHSSITCMLTVTTCKLLNGMQRNMWMAVTIGQILNIGPPPPHERICFYNYSSFYSELEFLKTNFARTCLGWLFIKWVFKLFIVSLEMYDGTTIGMLPVSLKFSVFYIPILAKTNIQDILMLQETKEEKSGRQDLTSKGRYIYM